MMKYNFRYERVGAISTGQDGTIYGDYLFRFDSDGSCKVFSLTNWALLSSFVLDKSDLLTPHSNSACFGNRFFEEGDAFPLLYCNVYNTYSEDRDRREGTCCVYRLLHEGTGFISRLVQVIRIGFIEDLTLWKSLEMNQDVRPYGNFVVDSDSDRLYAFTMRDKEAVTRYFAFPLPNLCEGVYDEQLDANVVTLDADQILSQFDCEYARYLQGACCHGGKIYSLEGFADETDPPKMQVIDLEKQEQCAVAELFQMGLRDEPELVAFKEDTLYYANHAGEVYLLHFD